MVEAAQGLDLAVKNEGAMLTQAGIAALGNGGLEALATRLTHRRAGYDKFVAAIAAVDKAAAEKAAEPAPASPPAKPPEPAKPLTDAERARADGMLRRGHVASAPPGLVPDDYAGV